MSRGRQEDYSAIQPRMLDEADRRVKAGKIVSVLEYHLGRTDLSGLTSLDVGCSGGTIARTIAERGAWSLGGDIDHGAVAEAARRSGAGTGFFVADGEALPVASGSIDLAVFNQSYEHVVSPERVVDELVRALSPDGVVYLGLHNRYSLFEPHYHLPFLAWLPPKGADRYLRLLKRGDHYHERLLGWSKLKALFRRFTLWDYSYTVAAEPERFSATDVASPKASAIVRAMPASVRKAAAPLVPGYVWIGTRSDAPPRGVGAVVPPRRIASAQI